MARVVAAGGPALSAVAGAVSRDCRRGCGARCRRGGAAARVVAVGARLSPQWPAQCPETAEGAAARVVAAGGPALSAGAPANRIVSTAGRMFEKPVSALLVAARVVAAGGPCKSQCKCCGEDV